MALLALLLFFCVSISWPLTLVAFRLIRLCSCLLLLVEWVFGSLPIAPGTLFERRATGISLDFVIRTTVAIAYARLMYLPATYHGLKIKGEMTSSI